MSRRGTGKGALWCMTAAQAEVTKEFKPEQEGQLSLKIGDKVTIIAQNPDGWWAGAVQGQIGVFPAECVNQVSTIPTATSKKPELPPLPLSELNDTIPVPPRPRLPSKERTSPRGTGATQQSSPRTTQPQPPPPVSFASKPVIPSLLGSGGTLTSPKGPATEPKPKPPPGDSFTSPRTPPPVPSASTKPRTLSSYQDVPLYSEPPVVEDGGGQALDPPGDSRINIEEEEEELVFVDAEPEAPPLLPGTEDTEDDFDTESTDEGSISEDPKPDEGKSFSDKWLRAEHKRQEIINEIVNTERDYLRDLNITINVFVIPLKLAKIIPDGDISLLFSNIVSIRNVNRQFYNNLLSKIRTQDAVTPTTPIGGIFADMADYFKMYTIYCSNHPRALETKNRLLAKNANFKKYLRFSESDAACHNLQLADYLIKPVQRICKYPILLRELLKYTEEEHEDYELLKVAEKKITEVVAHIDNASKKVEENHQVLEIQTYTGDTTLLSQKRKFLREVLVQVYPSGQPAKAEEVVLYIFDEILIVCRPKKPKYLQKRKRIKNCFEAKTIPLSDVKLINLHTESFFGFELDRGERKGLQLVNISEKMVFVSKSAAEIHALRVELNKLIKGITQRRLKELKPESDSPDSDSPGGSGAKVGNGDGSPVGSGAKMKKSLSGRGLNSFSNLLKHEKEPSPRKNLEKAAELLKKGLEEPEESDCGEGKKQTGRKKSAEANLEKEEKGRLRRNTSESSLLKKPDGKETNKARIGSQRVENPLYMMSLNPAKPQKADTPSGKRISFRADTPPTEDKDN